MKKFAYSLIIIIGIIFISVNSEAYYWKQVKNIPATYANNYWLDVYFLPSDTRYGWICGFNGMVLRTTDGGDTWQGSLVPNADHLESVTVTSPTVGYTSGVSGIFKSVDGGATWTDITPTGAIDLWGNYFVDDNNGLVIGGGCATEQYFWKTTDGGATWTDFVASEPNSGLTDLLLSSATGLGYAVSSGRLWKTTDGGTTWSIFANSGSNVWQEEISHYNNSFLVPYSGTICTGGGDDGGMRFSVDNGATWREFSTGVPMFGAFLLNDVTGWACGYNMNIWYTSDGGLSWHDRGCSIEKGHLDDVWFNSPTDGWVVGEGIYRLSRDTLVLSKSNMDFGDVCIPGFRSDTLWLKNYSFQASDAHVEILDDPDVNYYLEEPAAYFSTPNCDSERVVVTFRPRRSGVLTARLVITDNNNNVNLTVGLTGRGVVPTAQVNDTLLVINPAVVNSPATGNLVWKSYLDSEYISKVVNVEGDKNITVRTLLPTRISAFGTNLVFSVVPKDTGWTSARFKVHLLPCDNDTFITVRVYGVSPIISSDQDRQLILECAREKLENIPIRNTGNSQLVIRSAQVLDPNSGFSVIGWTSKKTLPVFINPGEADSIIVKFAPPKPGTYSTILRIANNDSTTARGIKNPYDLSLTGTYSFSRIEAKDTTIDLGEICLGSSAEAPLIIRNTGNLDATVSFRSLKGMFYSLSCGNQIIVKDKDSSDCKIMFTPDKPGSFLDTLIVENKACNQVIYIEIKARAISGEISVAPASISVSLKTGNSFVQKVTITAKGTEPVKIVSITPTPGINDWSYTVSPALPVDINPGESKDFDITFTAGATLNYSGTLCVSTEGKCPVVKCIPLELLGNNKSIAWSKNSINFGLIKCDKNLVSDTLYIINTGLDADSVTRLDLLPDESNFRFINKPALPFLINSNDSLPVIVEYYQANEGSFSAKLVFETGSLAGNPVEIPISGEFRRSIISPLDTTLDFGKIESCQSIIILKQAYKNEGTLNETLVIDKTALTAGYSLMTADTISVESGNTAEIAVAFDPQSVTAAGVYSGKIVLHSLQCPGLYTLNLKAEIIYPELVISPVPLDFGNVIPGSKKPGIVTIVNNSSVSRTITGIEAKNYKSNFLVNNTIPFDMQPGQSVNINVDFSAAQAGVYSDSLVISSQTACSHTDYAMLNAVVTEENFDIIVSAGKYVRIPGDSLTIALWLNHGVHNADISKISFDIAFDKMLFSPRAVLVRQNNNYVQLPFKYDYNSLSGEITGDMAANLLNDSGAVINIRGLVLASIPDTTILSVNNFDVESSRHLNITRQNGLLTINGICRPVVANRLALLPGFTASLSQQVITGQTLDITLGTTADINIKVVITDLLGNKVRIINNFVRRGDNMLNLNIDGVSDGMYNITITSEYNQVWHNKFIKTE